MIRPELSTKLKTTISTQMIQFTGLLNMTNYELLNYVQTQLEENPVLEPVQPAYGLPEKFVWCSSSSYSSRGYNYDEKNMFNQIPDREEGETLYNHVHEQLLGSNYSDKQIYLVEYLICCLDKNGYLVESCEEIAERLCIDINLVNDSLRILRKKLSPAGIGARDLKDCLLIQLRRSANVPEYTEKIVCEHLQDVAKCKYKSIAKKLDAGLSEVYEAIRFIKSLDPKPASHFCSGDKTNYIVPDVVVVNTPDGFEIALNDSWIPELRLSSYYAELMKLGDEDVRNYLSEKFNQARMTIRSIEQRRNTIILCIKEIVEIQKSFFWVNRHVLYLFLKLS